MNENKGLSIQTIETEIMEMMKFFEMRVLLNTDPSLVDFSVADDPESLGAIAETMKTIDYECVRLMTMQGMSQKTVQQIRQVRYRIELLSEKLANKQTMLGSNADAANTNAFATQKSIG